MHLARLHERIPRLAAQLAEQAVLQRLDSLRFQYQLLLENQPSTHGNSAWRTDWLSAVAGVRRQLVGARFEHVVLAIEQRCQAMQADARASTELKQVALCEHASESEDDYMYSDYSSSDNDQS